MTDKIPVKIAAQFKRHAGRYGVGLLLLGLYQVSQWWFDNHFMSAINAATAGNNVLALALGQLLVLVALGAFVTRVLSRLTVFNAGRIAEYELRKALLHRLQRLGPAFFRYELKRAWKDGTRAIFLSPLELCARVCPLVRAAAERWNGSM